MVRQRRRSRSAALLAEISKFAGADPDRTSSHLLAAIRKHFEGLNTHLFETRGSRLSPVESDVAIETLADVVDVDACLSDREPVTRISGEELITLIPMLVNDTTAMVIVASSTSDSHAKLDELIELIRTYGNVLSLVQVSERDTLTGLYNRRMLDRQLLELTSNLASPRRRCLDPVSVHLALMDLDRFKEINDVYGHLYGDEVLFLFSGLMKQSFRSTDLLVRYGGEEFVAVLTDTTLHHCKVVLERFRAKVEDHWFPHVGHVTVSAGSARISGETAAATVIDQADQALYYAKQHGRNRVCMYEELVREGLIEAKQTALASGRMFEEKAFEEKRKLPSRRKSISSDRRRSGANN
ncbi:MAG: GGDEF domain-containing protein [Burkholderiales bacterium]|jgi:diguanylate cyclase (GGDEF)-like protein